MRANKVFENTEFKRGKNSKISLGIGKYTEISEWWDKFFDDHLEKEPNNISSTFLFHVTMKLVNILRKEDNNTGWTRDDAASSYWDIVGDEMMSGRLQGPNYQSIIVAVDFDGDIYIRGKRNNRNTTPEIKAGNLGLNPGDVISNILHYKEIIDKENKLDKLEKRRIYFLKKVQKNVENLLDLKVLSPEMSDEIFKLTDEIIEIEFNDES